MKIQVCKNRCSVTLNETEQSLTADQCYWEYYNWVTLIFIFEVSRLIHYCCLYKGMRYIVFLFPFSSAFWNNVSFMESNIIPWTRNAWEYNFRDNIQGWKLKMKQLFFVHHKYIRNLFFFFSLLSPALPHSFCPAWHKVCASFWSQKKKKVVLQAAHQAH